MHNHRERRTTYILTPFTILVAALLFLVWHSAAVFAAEDTSDGSYALEPMVVSATRSPMREENVAANITVITAKQIENLPATNVAEVLRYIPDVYVEFNGGSGSDASGVRIQGSNTRQVTIYQDGVPLNQLANPRTDLSQLASGTIERIEIYKGAASSAWGSALGGVINIITKEPDREKPLSVAAQAAYGEFQTLKNRASISGTRKRFGYLVSGRHERSDGFIEHTGYEQNNVYAKFNVDLGETSRLNLVASHDQGYSSDPIPDHPEFWDDADHARTYQRLLFETAPTAGTFLTVEGRHHQYETLIEDVYRDHRETYSDYEDENWGGSARLRWDATAANVLVAGWEGDWGNYDWINYTQTYDSASWAAYLNDTHTIGRLSFNAGLRHDENRDFGAALSPSAGIAWRINDKKKALLRAQVAKGFSAPPAAWVHDPTYGDPDLDPETAVNIQLGAELQPIENLDMTVNLFHADVKNLINFDVDTQRFANIDRVTRRGLEWSLAWRSRLGLDLGLAGSHVQVTDDRTGETIKDIPRTTFNLSAQYTHAWMTHTLLGRLIDHNSSFPETKDRKLICDYQVRVKLPLAMRSGRWDLFFTAHNLFDTDYLYREVWPKPGRWVEGGVSVAY